MASGSQPRAGECAAPPGGDRPPLGRAAIRWLDEPAGYLAAAAGAGTLIPVLRPASARKASLWQDVTATLFGGPACPVPGGRLVAALGATARPAARVYAGFSGSRLVGCGSADEAIAAVHAGPEESAVVVAAAAELTVAVIARVLAAGRAAGKPVGFLAGRDLAGLSFSVAKSLLLPRDGLAGLDVFDAPDHADEANARRMPPGFRDLLSRPCLAKVVRSHGEGGHAKLPGVVACGLLDEAEFPGAPDAGCARAPRRCKRAGKTAAQVVFGDELAAAVIAFACCNGFNVAGELYPSQVSMALSFAEGWAAAVIAPIRPLVASDDMVAIVREGLSQGQPLGTIVTELNRVSAATGQQDAFVLHGDPLTRVPAPDQRRPSPRPGPGQGGCPPAELAALRDRLVATLQQAERGRRLLRSAGAWLGDQRHPLTEPLAARLRQVEELSLNALKWAQASPSGDSLQRLLRTATVIKLGVAHWDKAAARLLLSARQTLDAFDLGHYDQVLDSVTEGPACLRCGTPTEVHAYGRGEPAEQRRLAELCLVCGPVSERRQAGPGLAAVRADTAGAGGTEYRLEAQLRVPAQAAPRPCDSAQVFLRFYDKANDECVHEEARTLPARSQRAEFRLRLPERIGTDLHSVRLVAVCCFDVAYLRTRFASLPPGYAGAAAVAARP